MSKKLFIYGGTVGFVIGLVLGAIVAGAVLERDNYSSDAIIGASFLPLSHSHLWSLQ